MYMAGSQQQVVRGEHSFTVLTSAPDALDYNWFWPGFANGGWENSTLDLMARMIGPETLFLDVGAWIGPTALWAACHGAEVHAFEPDVTALKMLRRNLALNPSLASRVTVVPAAVGIQDGDIELHAPAMGGSETSCFKQVERGPHVRTSGENVTVPTVDLVNYIRRLGPQGRHVFLKMDIEGGEFHMLPALHDAVRKYGVDLHVSFHPQNIILGDNDVTLAGRMTKLAAALEPYVGMNWYEFAGGRFERKSRVDHLIALMTNLSRGSDLLITSREL